MAEDSDRATAKEGRVRAFPWGVLSDVRSYFVGFLCLVVLTFGCRGSSPTKPEQLAKPKPLTEQLDRLRTELAQGPAEVLVAEVSRGIHGSGIQSYIFVVGPSREVYDYRGVEELRIYDVVGGKLVHRLTFGARESRGLLLDISGFEDLDGDGDQELIGQYVYQSEDRGFAYPLIVSWDDERSSYRVAAVVTQPPRLTAHQADDFFAQVHHEGYLEEQDLGTPTTGVATPVTSYATGPFEIVRGGLHYLLLAAFVNTEDGRYEILGWSFYNEDGQAKVYVCPGNAFVHLDPDLRLEPQLTEAWSIDGHGDCSL